MSEKEIPFQPDSKTPFKIKMTKINVALLAVFAVLVILFVMAFNYTIFHAKDRFNSDPIEVTIDPNTPTGWIARILYEKGVIDNTASFKLTAKLLFLESRLRAGTYYFSQDMSNYKLLKAMKEGRILSGDIKVTIPEGSSIHRIGMILERRGVTITGGSFDMLESVGINSILRLKYPFLKDVPIYSLEGYLFPDTYYLPKKVKIDLLVELMLNRFEQVILPAYYSAYSGKYSLHEILTLAAIIEKEAEKDSERAVIASVFFNRLENGMLLRADPTVKYALAFPTKRVLYSHLLVDSKYNTYKYTGLPPGPICNPGLKSVLAAIHPAKTNYLYFVANGDGSSSFSATWGGHAKAVSKFRKVQDRSE